MANSLKQGVWVVVCDGSKALLLENIGDAAYPNLKMRMKLEQDNPPSHVQGSARPGKVINSGGYPHAALTEVDIHDQAEHTFLRRVADMLGHTVRERQISKLMIIAPARALGVLRPLLPAHVQKMVVEELAHDYVMLPLYEIESHLKALH